MADGKWIAGLTPGTPAVDAARAVLEARFAVVGQYLPLAAGKPDEDVEYVHQLRVGTRRAAAALRVFRSALPRKAYKEMKLGLRTLRRAAGDARDWDVFLAALPEAKPFADVAARPACDFLVGYAFGERASAQQRLAATAAETGPAFLQLSAELPARVRPGGDHEPADFGALAGEQLGALFRAFTADVEANPTAPEELHALRIVGKRLRYAIEIFADCFPPALRDSVYPAVERVQEILGDVQDAAVGLHRLDVIRATVRAVMPKQLTRVRKGLDALSATLRAKIPAGKKAFAGWRGEWLELTAELKLEVVTAVATAAS
jgi:CHAD domain-containing protein